MESGDARERLVADFIGQALYSRFLASGWTYNRLREATGLGLSTLRRMFRVDRDPRDLKFRDYSAVASTLLIDFARIVQEAEAAYPIVATAPTVERPTSDADIRRASELVHRLGILMDAYELEGGIVRLSDISEQMQFRGLALSRPTWVRLITLGQSRVNERPLLAALAELFGERPEYLLDLDAKYSSPRLESHMPSILSKREEQLLGLAARTIGPVTPETYAAIAKTLTRDLDRLNALDRAARDSYIESPE